jgi:benzoate/toluate 1,2-dioxygenase beta subunit
MSAGLTRAEAEDLLYREALLMDTGRFSEWLGLFTSDVEFWMPAWRDELTTTEDPERELSLIHYRGRRNLEDRVMRLTSGLSTASTPLPRVVHLVTNILVTASAPGQAAISAAFTCHRFDVRMNRADCFFGRYEYGVIREDGSWKIARKKVILLNDVIPTVVDINAI